MEGDVDRNVTGRPEEAVADKTTGPLLNAVVGVLKGEINWYCPTIKEPLTDGAAANMLFPDWVAEIVQVP